MNQLATSSQPPQSPAFPQPAPSPGQGVERICFLFRHFDRAGLDAVMTLSNRGALWVRRRPWSPTHSIGTERGFITSRAPLADILEVHTRPHRPFQRLATAVAAVVLAVLAFLGAGDPMIAMGYATLALAAAALAKFWPPVLVIVARAGRFSYRGPWSVNGHTVANVERALREVAAWTRCHQIPLVGRPKSTAGKGPPQKANPICIEITSFSPATES